MASSSNLLAPRVALAASGAMAFATSGICFRDLADFSHWVHKPHRDTVMKNFARRHELTAAYLASTAVNIGVYVRFPNALPTKVGGIPMKYAVAGFQVLNFGMWFLGYVNPEIMMRPRNHNALYVTPAEADKILRPEETLIVTQMKEKNQPVSYYAFADNQIQRPHIANLGITENGVPAIFAYCALTGGGIAFEYPEKPGGKKRDPIPYIQLENNLIVFDKANGEWGHQLNTVNQNELMEAMGVDNYDLVARRPKEAEMEKLGVKPWLEIPTFRMTGEIREARHDAEPPYDAATMVSGIQRSPRNPFHEGKTVRRGPICSAIFLLIAIPLVLVNVMRTTLEGDELKWKLRDTMGGSPRADGKYKGKLWKTEQTLGRTLLGETEFARCDVHSVVSADHKTIINDWLFLEERDHINAAVYTKEGKFLLFQQRKYAIPGETLSPVGGFINDGETPFDAARREVVEELGMGSAQTAKLLKKSEGKKEAPEKGKQYDAFEIPAGDIVLDEFGLASGAVTDDEQSQWVFLGRYRTAANRGGGFLYTYLLMDAVPVVETGGTAEYLRTGDEEEQKLVSMTLDEVTTAVINAEFQEVKWTATVSLALMHIQKRGAKTQ